jgi:hypothetical protein
MDLELTSRHISGTNGVMKDMPTFFNAMEHTVFSSATDMDSYENEAREQQLQESTKMGRLAQDQFYTVKESVPSYPRSSTDRRISPMNENIVAPKPRRRVDDSVEEHERKLDSLRSLENIRAELEAIKIDDLEDEVSPPLLARENPLDGYSNGLSNGHGNGCSHDHSYAHSHDQLHGHSNGFLTGTSHKEVQDKQVVQHFQDLIQTLQQEVTSLMDIDQQMNIQFEQYKQQKSALRAILSQKDHGIRKLESDMDTLKATIQAKTQERNQQRDVRVKRLVDEITKRDKEIEVLKNDIIEVANSAAELRRTLWSAESERSSLLETHKYSHEYIAQIRNLTNTLSEREELYKRQTLKVESLQAANEEFMMENHLLRKNAPSQGMINELEEKLKDKTAENSRNVNELRDMRKRYDNSQAAIEKAANDQKSLCGAAHLTKPSQKVKFHSTVFGCVECYVKGLECDSGARCRNCTDSDSMCLRWRCSLVQILKFCPPDRPCGLVHGQDGWVSTREARPQW